MVTNKQIAAVSTRNGCNKEKGFYKRLNGVDIMEEEKEQCFENDCCELEQLIERGKSVTDWIAVIQQYFREEGTILSYRRMLHAQTLQLGKLIVNLMCVPKWKSNHAINNKLVGGIWILVDIIYFHF